MNNTKELESVKKCVFYEQIKGTGDCKEMCIL